MVSLMILPAPPGQSGIKIRRIEMAQRQNNVIASKSKQKPRLVSFRNNTGPRREWPPTKANIVRRGKAVLNELTIIDEVASELHQLIELCLEAAHAGQIIRVLDTSYGSRELSPRQYFDKQSANIIRRSDRL